MLVRGLAAAAAVVIIDQLSKAAVLGFFGGSPLGALEPITPFFNLVLTHNPGAAFSFLAHAGGWQRWFFAAIAVAVSAVVVVMLRRQHAEPRAAVALALVLGGALGNLWERVTLGYVVDFVQVHAAGYYWPAFNVADSAIFVGVAILIWDGLRPAARAPKESA